jgi:hypothetical protein
MGQAASTKSSGGPQAGKDIYTEKEEGAQSTEKNRNDGSTVEIWFVPWPSLGCYDVCGADDLYWP